jgi:hypothetical protein
MQRTQQANKRRARVHSSQKGLRLTSRFFVRACLTASALPSLACALVCSSLAHEGRVEAAARRRAWRLWLWLNLLR